MNEEQFLRLERLIGKENVSKLHNARITLVGVGAVGGYALEALARSGVGHIRLVDFDVVSITNINRQIIATYSTIGQSKVEVAKKRVLDINPFAEVEACNCFADKDNYESLLKDSDIVLDCIDSLTPKVGLIEYAVKNGYTIISSMGAALRRDLSLIRVSDIKDTWACPLARQVRGALRKRGIETGVRVVFSPETVNFKYIPVDEDTAIRKDDKIDSRGRDRVILGSLATVTACFGEYMATEALKILTDEKQFQGEEAWNPEIRNINR